MLGLAVLADIDESLLRDARQFAAHTRRLVRVVYFGQEARLNSGLALEAFHGVGEKAGKTLAIDIERLHLLHEFAQLQHFLAKKPLNAPKLASEGVRLSLCL